MKGRYHIKVFNRLIPREIIGRTIAIIFASAFSIGLITSVLLFFGGGGDLPPEQSRHFFVEYLFETVSAFGTVGLSMGITPKLNDIQKLAIVLMMFAGRVCWRSLFPVYRGKKGDQIRKSRLWWGRMGYGGGLNHAAACVVIGMGIRLQYRPGTLGGRLEVIMSTRTRGDPAVRDCSPRRSSPTDGRRSWMRSASRRRMSSSSLSGGSGGGDVTTHLR
jgi:hypothetical protein